MSLTEVGLPWSNQELGRGGWHSSLEGAGFRANGNSVNTQGAISPELSPEGISPTAGTVTCHAHSTHSSSGHIMRWPQRRSRISTFPPHRKPSHLTPKDETLQSQRQSQGRRMSTATGDPPSCRPRSRRRRWPAKDLSRQRPLHLVAHRKDEAAKPQNPQRMEGTLLSSTWPSRKPGPFGEKATSEVPKFPEAPEAPENPEAPEAPEVLQTLHPQGLGQRFQGLLACAGWFRLMLEIRRLTVAGLWGGGGGG